MNCPIQEKILESVAVKVAMADDAVLLQNIARAAQLLIHTFQQQGKVLFCGNGGSAADAQHLAAELSGRFYHDRAPLFAEALHVNSSFLTAVANDYHFEKVYARMIEAAGRPGDVLVAISTSGNSPNILAACETARQKGMKIIGFTGKTGGKMVAHCDIALQVPSNDTPRVQEAHILLGHILCEWVERAFT